MLETLKTLLAGQTAHATRLALADRGVEVNRSTCARWHRGTVRPSPEHWAMLVDVMLDRNTTERQGIIDADEEYRRGTP
jgi:hypothetical protein